MSATTRRLRRWSLLVAVGLLAACGGDDSGDNDTSSATTAAQSGETAATTAALTGDPVTIMQIVTQSGPSNNVPEDADAAQAAVDAVNAEGGVQGHPLELVTCDDGYDPNKAADCARQAVEQDVAAVVFLNSAFGDRVVPVLEEAGIPSVGDNLITAAEFMSPIVYPISGGAIIGAPAQGWAVAHADATSIRPLVIDVPAASGLVPFIEQAVSLFPDATMLDTVPVPPTASDVTSQASAATSGGADGAFIIIGQGGAAPLLRAMRSSGFTGPVATSTQSISPEELSDLGDEATGLLLVSAMPPPTYTENASVARFREDMEAAGLTDDLTGGMLLAWTSVRVSAMGLEAADTLDAPGLIAALDGYGPIEFDGLGTWNYAEPLAAFGGMRVFNPFQYISEVTDDGVPVPISPEPFDITSAPTE